MQLTNTFTMKTINVRDKQFSLFIEKKKIESVVEQMAARINEDMNGKVPRFLVVLNGAFIFAVDLLRKLTLDCEISFVKLSSYAGTKSTSIVRELIGLDENVKDRTVVILEDIIDSGLTMDNTINKLHHLGAAEVKIASLLFKPSAFRKDFKIDFVGMEIPDDFIIGYGLDYDGFGRNLTDIYQIASED